MPHVKFQNKNKMQFKSLTLFFIPLSQLLNIYIICLPTKLLNVYKVVKTLHLKLILLSQINKLYEFWQTRAFKLFAYKQSQYLIFMLTLQMITFQHRWNPYFFVESLSFRSKDNIDKMFLIIAVKSKLFVMLNESLVKL